VSSDVHRRVAINGMCSHDGSLAVRSDACKNGPAAPTAPDNNANF
jgi:hypothetical protein